jgi:hypothetical protein
LSLNLVLMYGHDSVILTYDTSGPSPTDEEP